MTPLRFLNPFYAARLEHDLARLSASATKLAQSTKLLAQVRQHDPATLVDIRETLEGIAGLMASGRTHDAKIMIDCLTLALQEPTHDDDANLRCRKL